MKHLSFHSLRSIRALMIILNTIHVIFLASFLLLTTKYIVDHQLARRFLDEISHLPHHPQWIFFCSILLFALFVFLIYHRDHQKNTKINMIYMIIEIIVCFFIMVLLNMEYNGIIFLVFCDGIYHMKDNRYSKGILAILVFMYFICQYDVLSIFIKMNNMQLYFEVYSAHIKGILLMSKTILETLNILLFISFIIVYIADQIQENENISQELSMIHQVNQELQNYAAITEKIGENNERKRLAREIHDTLGHALTGIAAGVDACIAMIDINPQATKQQLQLVSKVVRQGIGDVRNSLNKLRPGALEEQGFKEAIEKMIEEFASVSDLDIEFQYDVDKLDLENTKEDILFRIIQESITNALRHGGASHIDIHFYQEEKILFLKIQDNGQGCEDIHYGFGLKQMEERVAIINGEVEFDGHNGFRTIVKIPLQKGENYD